MRGQYAPRPSTFPEPGKKRCPKCREVKLFGEFYRREGGKLAAYCKDCKKDGKVIQRMRMRDQKPEDVAERFFAKVNKTDGCWIWTGAKGYLGYGRFMFRGRMDQAHVVSLLIAGVDVPSRWTTGLAVDHICKVSSCVRPEHLRLVPQIENCTSLADPTPFQRNRTARECLQGHPFSPGNTAITLDNRKRGTRSCLTCEPSRWRYAIVERAAPSNARLRKHGGWRGPAVTDYSIEDGIVTFVKSLPAQGIVQEPKA